MTSSMPSGGTNGRATASDCSVATGSRTVGSAVTRGFANAARMQPWWDPTVFSTASAMFRGSWFTTQLGFDPRTDITLADWLATPAQLFAEVTAGAVFHGGLGELVPARANLDWYPHDLWLHLLACQWQRVAQEEAFVGRCGEVGDELGSAVVAARLVRDLMRLCLLMERRYPPYSKWLGSAFAGTPQAPALTPVLTAALAATDWHTREHHLARAYEAVAATHNQLGLTDPVDLATRPYHARPFQVLHAERFTAALSTRITDTDIRALPKTGAVDQFVDSADVLSDPGLTRAATNGLLSP